jgi:hypothetical protein
MNRRTGTAIDPDTIEPREPWVIDRPRRRALPNRVERVVTYALAAAIVALVIYLSL